MKKILLFCIFSIGFTMLMRAQQLKYSTWTRIDTYLINDTVFMHFDENTCTISTAEGLLVSSNYTEEGNVFTIQDIIGVGIGQHACSGSSIGNYTFTVLYGTALHFTLVSDDCNSRAISLTAGPFTRMPPKTICIPDDFTNIQQGILAADNHDTVLVAPGTYYENISFMGKKPLTIASRFIVDGNPSHIANTILNGSRPLDPDKGSVVTFASGEDSTSVLCGFTITGGTGTYIAAPYNFRMGGGVFISQSGGKLLNNNIENNIVTNESWATGGGINATGPEVPESWVVLRKNRITHNTVTSSNDQGSGGGVEIWYNLVMEKNVLSYNEATGAYRGDGGGARISGNFGPIVLDIRNNQITHNKAISKSNITDIAISGGLDIFLNCSGVVSGNTINSNEIEVAPGKWCYGTGVMVETIDTPGFIFENNIINDNSFTGGYCMGGGLLLYDAAGIFQNNVVQNNQGTLGGGVGFGTYNSDNMPVFINNTITGNEGIQGGGLWSATDAVVINSIIWDNTADEGASIFVAAEKLEVRYSDVEGNGVWPGEGNVNCDANFMKDGYHLDSCQLLEAGTASILINGTLYNCPAYDIDGEERPLDIFPEIGADEVLLSIVSVPEPIPANSLAFNIYPNPASGKITVELNGATTGMTGDVSIIGITGKELLRQHITGPKTEINVSTLPAGVYFIQLIPDDQNAAVKIGKFVKNQ